MKRLCELVDIAVNNEACVVFKPKKDTRMDLIALGCFRGDEEIIRMTKGRTPEITVFYQDGKSFSYHFGEGSTTVISDNMQKQREMVRACAILDFGIVCDWSYMGPDRKYLGLVRDTMAVRSMGDAQRNVEIASGGGFTGHIRVNGQTVARDVNVKDMPGWFEERGYHVEFQQDILKGLPCGIVFGECAPLKEYEISQMPYKSSEDKLVRYVQTQLDCDRGLACVFISGYEDARCMRDAQRALGYYGTEIAQAGLRVRHLTDEDLLQLGKALERGDKNILADFAESEIDFVVDWVRNHQGKTVDGIILDANDRAGGSGGKSEVDFEIEK